MSEMLSGPATAADVCDPAEESQLPFSLSSFRTSLGALADSVRADWMRWAEQAVQIAGLAKQVPQDENDWAWKSFVREIAVVRRCSDQAAAKEIFLAVALVTAHPRTLSLLQAGQLPLFHARVLLEESASCAPEVSAAVDAELADRAIRLSPARIRDEVRRIQLRYDADAAAVRSAKAASARNVQLVAERDDQATLILTGPALPVARFYASLTKAARAARAAGDPRGLDALRFDLAFDLDGTDPATETVTSVQTTSVQTTSEQTTSVQTTSVQTTSETPAADAGQAETDAAMTETSEPSAAAPGPGASPSEQPVVPSWLGDRRRVRPAQVLIHLPVTTALGLTNEPGWVPGLGWISAPQCREWMITAELRQVCIDATGMVVDSADRVVRPEPTPTGVREAVLAMIADPGEITDKTYRHEPQHDPSDALRAFVDLRDPYCDGPTGTRVPAQRCDDDHNQPYPEGPTAAWNLRNRAARTHQLKHRGWIPQRLANSTIWTSPAGQTIEVEHRTGPPPDLELDPDAHLPDPDELRRIDAEYLRPPDRDDYPPFLEPF